MTGPHVGPIHDHGEIGGRLYTDMRYVSVRGRDLAATILERAPQSPEDAVAVIGQVARALDAAHAERLVHREVKPSNILLPNAERRTRPHFAYLADFGIVRPQDNATSEALGCSTTWHPSASTVSRATTPSTSTPSPVSSTKR